MAVWVWVVVTILFVTIVLCLSGAAYKGVQNRKRGNDLRLYTFSGSFASATGAALPLTKVDAQGNTVPAISCPAGTTVDVLGAFYDVYDPYLECTQKADPLIFKSCNLDNGNVNSPCKGDADCGSSGAVVCEKGYCRYNPFTAPVLCKNLDPTTAQNMVCGPQNAKSGCRPRDATFFLSRMCNGKTSCDAKIDSDHFGPYPCSFGTGPCTGPTTSGYCGLPVTAGNQDAAGNNVSTNHGYTVHGIYSCQPNPK